MFLDLLDRKSAEDYECESKKSKFISSEIFGFCNAYITYMGVSGPSLLIESPTL